MKRLAIGIIAALIIGAGIVFALNMKDKDETEAPTGTPTIAQTESSDGQTDNSGSSGSGEQSTPPSAATSSVTIESFAFTPQTITVNKGSTVTWTNKDSAAHTVTADSGNGPDSELLQQGQTYSFKFDEVGTFKYHCQPHPSMTGTVVVQ